MSTSTSTLDIGLRSADSPDEAGGCCRVTARRIRLPSQASKPLPPGTPAVRDPREMRARSQRPLFELFSCSQLAVSWPRSRIHARETATRERVPRRYPMEELALADRELAQISQASSPRETAEELRAFRVRARQGGGCSQNFLSTISHLRE
eukprot:tig00021105_g18253.t1